MSKPKRFHICIVCSGFWGELKGGAEYQLYVLARELALRGHRVSYIYESQTALPRTEDGVEYVPLRTPRLLKRFVHPSQCLAAKGVFKALDTLKPQMILNRVANALTGIVALYSRRRGVPFIWHVANSIDVEQKRLAPNKHYFSQLIEKKFLDYGIRNSENTVAQAGYQSDLLLANFGKPASIVIPNGHHVPPEWSPARGLPVRVVWIGKYKAKKNPELFAEIARHFAGDSRFDFVMIGNASENSRQKEIAARIASAGNVRQLGELPFEEVNSVLSTAHAYVNTSTFEGFPNTYIQAWMRGVPVLSLEVDPDGVIKRNEIGFFSGSVEQMVADLKSIADQPGLREAMAVRAREFSVSNYAIGRVVDRYEEYIDGLLRQCS